MNLLMLDLFSGLGGASQAMRDCGWKVVTIDNEPKFKPDLCADIRKFLWWGSRPDLIWASPPCDEFSRESMPWSRTGQQPSMELYDAAIKFIKRTQPRYWIIENVRGAVRYFGKPREIHGPFFLWGYFPPLGKVNRSGWRKKESYGSKQREERAKIPYELSMAVAKAITYQPELIA